MTAEAAPAGSPAQGLPRSWSRTRWWAIGALLVSTLVALGSVVGRSAVERELAVVDRAPSEATTRCGGSLAARFDCHRQRYERLVWDAGAPAALAALQDDFETNEAVKAYCHQLVHAIGRAAGERYGDVPATFRQGDHFCGGGYYHGAMEAAVLRLGVGLAPAEADALCASVRDERAQGLYHYDCAHGLGHGILIVLDHELFAALAVCDALADAWERAPCHGGVFMENLMAEQHPGHVSRYLRADDPLYPCTAVAAQYKAQCFPIQTSHALQVHGDDFAATFPLCAHIEAEFRPGCYEGLGGFAAIVSMQTYLTDVGQVEAASLRCALGPDFAARSSCVAGAVMTFLDYGDNARATAFCETLDADLAATCLQTRERFLERIGQL